MARTISNAVAPGINQLEMGRSYLSLVIFYAPISDLSHRKR
jgi:hypothetical protein